MCSKFAFHCNTKKSISFLLLISIDKPKGASMTHVQIIKFKGGIALFQIQYTFGNYILC